jgi:hypothetical protein
VNPAPLAAVGLLIWAGLCAADQRALGSRQLHQPIVAAAGAGLLLHAPERALLVGLWLQLVWVAPMPIGGVLLPDTGSASIAATIVAVLLPGPVGLGIALVVGMTAGILSIPWERALRAGNARREAAALTPGSSGIGSGPTGVDPSEARSSPAHSAGIPRRGRPALALAMLHGIAGPFARGLLIAGIALLLGSILSGFIQTNALAPLSDAFGGVRIERALLGGAACFGLGGLFLRLRPEAGRSGIVWMLGGLLFGLAGRFLFGGGRG